MVKSIGLMKVKLSWFINELGNKWPSEGKQNKNYISTFKKKFLRRKGWFDQITSFVKAPIKASAEK